MSKFTQVHLNSIHLIIITSSGGSPEFCVACTNGSCSLSAELLCGKISSRRGGPLRKARVEKTCRRVRVARKKERFVSSLDLTD